MSGSQADFWQGPTGTLPVVNANSNIFEEVQVATAAQTVFTLATFNYTVGTKSIWVFRRPVFSDIGGELLRRTVDYIETASNKITLTAGATIGDIITFIAFGVNQLIVPPVLNGLPQGGATGAILQKISGSDYDATWVPQSSVTTLLDALRQNIASASSVNLSSIASNTRNILITGSVQIDGFQVSAGQVWVVKFQSALLLKNNANTVTNTGADITTGANSSCILRAIADNTVEILSYTSPGSDILVSSINGGSLGRRNGFYNGGMTNTQRGSQTLAATGSAIATDGWISAVSGTTVAATIQQIAVAGASTGFASLIVATTTGATNVSFSQRIEAKNSKRYSGKFVTISGKVRQGTAGSLNLTVTVNKANASDNFAGQTLVGTSAAIPCAANTDTLISATFNLGATDGDNGVEIGYNFAGIAALTAINFFFQDMQVEIGTIATPFEFQSVAYTDLECKRYLRCSVPGAPKGTNGGAVAGIAVSTTTLITSMKYDPAMRVTPTIQIWNNGTQNQIRNTTTNVPQANTVLAFQSHNVNGFMVIVFNTATLVVGNAYDFDLIISAEL